MVDDPGRLIKSLRERLNGEVSRRLPQPNSPGVWLSGLATGAQDGRVNGRIKDRKGWKVGTTAAIRLRQCRTRLHTC